ncbi:uncharacterized protein [Watersipora subatra]|uniref:uncharacterized protein isoform X2 n=1 Tax=Watersipora subatra TaxID=2589382 RepID=UPI00355BD62D
MGKKDSKKKGSALNQLVQSTTGQAKAESGDTGTASKPKKKSKKWKKFSASITSHTDSSISSLANHSQQEAKKPTLDEPVMESAAVEEPALSSSPCSTHNDGDAVEDNALTNSEKASASIDDSPSSGTNNASGASPSSVGSKTSNTSVDDGSLELPADLVPPQLTPERQMESPHSDSFISAVEGVETGTDRDGADTPKHLQESPLPGEMDGREQDSSFASASGDITVIHSHEVTLDVTGSPSVKSTEISEESSTAQGGDEPVETLPDGDDGGQLSSEHSASAETDEKPAQTSTSVESTSAEVPANSDSSVTQQLSTEHTLSDAEMSSEVPITDSTAAEPAADLSEVNEEHSGMLTEAKSSVSDIPEKQMPQSSETQAEITAASARGETAEPQTEMEAASDETSALKTEKETASGETSELQTEKAAASGEPVEQSPAVVVTHKEPTDITPVASAEIEVARGQNQTVDKKASNDVMESESFSKKSLTESQKIKAKKMATPPAEEGCCLIL